MNNFLRLKNISKYFNTEKKIKVLKNLSYNFNKGTMYALMGPSGSGKSTLLNLISLIDRPTLGSIRFNDHLVNFTNKKRNDIFLTPETPGGPKVNDNMPGMGVKEFKNFVEKNKSQKKINNKFLVNPNFLDKKVVGSHNITKDIKKIK